VADASAAVSGTDSPRAITFRDATLSDGEALWRFSTALQAESLPVVYQRSAAPTVESETAFISRLLAAPNSLLLLAMDGEEVVGVLDVHGSSHPQRAHLVSFGVSLAATHRRRGIARGFLERLLAWADCHPVVSRVELEVFATNAPAIRLYERMGFLLEGTKTGAVRVG
jgi:RimJ/RimL family protein N-acetyltransferase